ncbi:MAG TPA: RodZ domain-containing protein, partial [Candidatus Obscuribacterales bacterium]
MALDQIGQKLKAARESQGLSLADIYQRTKIPINHLQSIDNGIADDLPEPVYVSGFIRRYAECVGLNGQALSDEYRSFVDGANGNGRHAKPQRSMMDQPIMVTVPHSRGVRIEQHGPGFFKTMGVSVFWIIAILGLITFLFWYNSNQNISQDTSPILSLRDQPNRFNNVGPTGATPQASTAAPAAPDQPTDSRITLIASQHVWVEVKSVATGDSLFTGYLEAGDRRDFQDSQGLRVRAGNGGSLSV